MNPPIQINASIALSIKVVKCQSFIWSQFGKDNREIIPFDQYEFTFYMEVKIDVLNESINIVLSTMLLDKRNLNNKNEICTLKSFSGFQILNFKDILPKKDNTILIPDELLELCAGISLANTRGMFSVKLDGSQYSSVTVPLIDPKMFLPKRSTQKIA